MSLQRPRTLLHVATDYSSLELSFMWLHQPRTLLHVAYGALVLPSIWQTGVELSPRSLRHPSWILHVAYGILAESSTWLTASQLSSPCGLKRCSYIAVLSSSERWYTVASLHVAAANEAVVECAPYNLGNVSELWTILSLRGRGEASASHAEFEVC